MRRFPLFFSVLIGLASTFPVSAQEEAIVRRESISTAMAIAYYVCDDALKEVKLLQKEIDGFIASPTELNLALAKLSWVGSRLPYLQARGFTWIDSNGLGSDMFRSTLDSRPVAMDEIEGIVTDAKQFPTIDAASLRKASRELEGKTISGFGALEALMWSTGDKDHLPFQPSDPHGKRRGAYLKACAAMLEEDLSGLTVEFIPDSEANTRARMKAMEPDIAIINLMNGLARFLSSEVLEARLTLADDPLYLSHTSHFDVLHCVAGIGNVLAGAYVGTDQELKIQGTGLLAAFNDEDDDNRQSELRDAVNNAIKGAHRLPRPLSIALESKEEEHVQRIEECRDALKRLIEVLSR
ncbi:MAG: imelysin family protein [Verrucomicrobiota bacterium]